MPRQRPLASPRFGSSRGVSCTAWAQAARGTGPRGRRGEGGGTAGAAGAAMATSGAGAGADDRRVRAGLRPLRGAGASFGAAAGTFYQRGDGRRRRWRGRAHWRGDGRRWFGGDDRGRCLALRALGGPGARGAGSPVRAVQAVRKRRRQAVREPRRPAPAGVGGSPPPLRPAGWRDVSLPAGPGRRRRRAARGGTPAAVRGVRTPPRHEGSGARGASRAPACRPWRDRRYPTRRSAKPVAPVNVSWAWGEENSVCRAEQGSCLFPGSEGLADSGQNPAVRAAGRHGASVCDCTEMVLCITDRKPAGRRAAVRQLHHCANSQCPAAIRGATPVAYPLPRSPAWWSRSWGRRAARGRRRSR